MLFKSWLYYLENPDRKESEAVQVRYMFRTDHFSKDFHLQSAVSVWGPRTHKANCINSYTDPVPNLIHMNSSHLYRHAVTWAGSFSSLFSLRLKHCRVKSSSRGLMQLVSVALGTQQKVSGLSSCTSQVQAPWGRMDMKHRELATTDSRIKKKKKYAEEYWEWKYQGKKQLLEMRECQECKTEKIPLNNIIHAHRNRKEQKKTK